jgi:hypothetical protein
VAEVGPIPSESSGALNASIGIRYRLGGGNQYVRRRHRLVLRLHSSNGVSRDGSRRQDKVARQEPRGLNAASFFN